MFCFLNQNFVIFLCMLTFNFNPVGLWLNHKPHFAPNVSALHIYIWYEATTSSALHVHLKRCLRFGPCASCQSRIKLSRSVEGVALAPPLMPSPSDGVGVRHLGVIANFIRTCPEFRNISIYIFVCIFVTLRTI